MKNVSILWINTYFPFDPQTAHFDDTELRKVISDIELMMDSEEFDHVILNGDINWHRVRQNAFCDVIEQFVEKVGLCSVWEKFNISHTHIHTDHKSFSTLDHFLVDPELLKVVEEAVAVHLGDNLSRHSPMVTKVRVESLPDRSTQHRSLAAGRPGTRQLRGSGRTTSSCWRRSWAGWTGRPAWTAETRSAGRLGTARRETAMSWT